MIRCPWSSAFNQIAIRALDFSGQFPQVQHYSEQEAIPSPCSSPTLLTTQGAESSSLSKKEHEMSEVLFPSWQPPFRKEQSAATRCISEPRRLGLSWLYHCVFLLLLSVWSYNPFGLLALTSETLSPPLETLLRFNKTFTYSRSIA